jgi:hypothetical protein
MVMFKKIIYAMIVFSSLAVFSCYSDGGNNTIPGMTNELYLKVSGAWDWYNFQRTKKMKLSWGLADVVINESIIIDLGASPPFILTGGSGKFWIIQIESKSKNEISLFVKNAAHEEETGKVILHFLDNGKMWIESLLPINYFDYYGPDSVYFKRSGPDINKK